MNMGNSEPNGAEEEIEGVRKALDAETQRCFDAEKRLDQATADFEEFVSMAAHHLREPLRDVASFSQVMAETWAGRLDSNAEALLGVSRKARAEWNLCSPIWWITRRWPPAASSSPGRT